MADRDRNRGAEVQLEDVVEVGSRVSWGAIIAGAVMAMAISLLMTLLGAAIGLSASDNLDAESMGWGAAIWGVVTTVLALFLGGWITSQCVVGETKTESVVHGIIMWGAFVAMLLWLAASGINFGVSTGLQAATAAGNADNQTWQRMAQAAGVSQQEIDRWTDQTAAQARDPQNQAAAAEDAQETATYGTWLTLGGLLLSIAAAIAGAMLGAGPTFRLLPLHVTHRHVEHRGTMAGA